MSYELPFIYELQVTIICTSYELLFICELRIITYCTSYELIFTYELRVIIYCTSYKLNLSYELRITIYYTTWNCNVNCKVSLLYQPFICMVCFLQNQVFLVLSSCAMSTMLNYNQLFFHVQNFFTFL